MMNEFDVVGLTHDLQEYGLIKGSKGAGVHCHRSQEDYEAEFIEPPHVLTLNILIDKN